MKTLLGTVCLFLSVAAAAAAADFNGDGTNDVGIFRPSRGLWAVRGVTRVYYGGSSDDPMPGDYNGDGTVDIGIFRSSSGLWAVRSITRVYYGGSSDEPLAGISAAGGGVDSPWSQYDDKVFYTTGDVGIGTSAPVYPLHVKYSHHGSWLVGIHNTGYALNDYGLLVRADAGDPFWVQGSAGKSIFRVEQDGDVGIGVNNPAYTLDVAGKIRATGSVYYGGTAGEQDGSAYSKPDYVFEPGYDALSTTAVERFLARERHLPWLTPLKDETGGVIDMTRMAFETVETAENLQLQIITLSRIVRAQQQEIEALKARLPAPE